MIKPPSTNSLYPLSYGDVLSEYNTPTDPTYLIESRTSPGKHHRQWYQSQNCNNQCNNQIFDNTNASRDDLARGDLPTRGRCNSFHASDRAIRGPLQGIETSIASLHSSGKDSGIVDSSHEHQNAHICQCGQSTSQSSGESTK